MPSIPQPVLPPEAMPWARWVQDSLQAVIVDAQRKQGSDANLNAGQNSTMSMLVRQLGEVQSSIDDMIGEATFDGAQITTGTIAAARIPTQDASKISGGALNVASAIIGGNAQVNGHVYVPNSTLASFGSWTVAYIDGDGRLTRGASSARFKFGIIEAPEDEDYFQAQLKEFEMRDGNGWRVLGYIAEDLVGTDMERFVVWEREQDEEGDFHRVRDDNGDLVPLSIDWIPLLLAQNFQLRRELRDTNDKLESIEERLGKLEGNK